MKRALRFLVAVTVIVGFASTLAVGITDTDGDGITDGNDECPFTPEDYDGVEDSDGCPEGAGGEGDDSEGDDCSDNNECITDP